MNSFTNSLLKIWGECYCEHSPHIFNNVILLLFDPYKLSKYISGELFVILCAAYFVPVVGA